MSSRIRFRELCNGIERSVVTHHTKPFSAYSDEELCDLILIGVADHYGLSLDELRNRIERNT